MIRFRHTETPRLAWWNGRPAEEYPKGYGCADPPGFCHERCDCMDDGRPQQPWETHKHWLEDEPFSGRDLPMCLFDTKKTVLGKA